MLKVEEVLYIKLAVHGTRWLVSSLFKMFESFPDNKILDCPKFRPFADEKISVV